MNIPIKHIAVVLGLILGFAAPPAKAEPLQTSPAPLWTVPTQMLQTMPQANIEPLEPLKMADYKYSPMGTFPNPYPDQSQCTAGVACRTTGEVPSYWSAVDDHNEVVKTQENWQQSILVIEDYAGEYNFIHVPIKHGTAYYQGKEYNGNI